MTRSADEVLELAKPELVKWLRRELHVFAANVNVVTITDVVGGEIRTFVRDVEPSIAILRKHAPDLDAATVRKHMTPTTCAVLVVTADGAVMLYAWEWANDLSLTSRAAAS